MGFIKTAEQQFPVPQKDLTQIMNKTGIRPSYNLASIVNKSTTLQR